MARMNNNSQQRKNYYIKYDRLSKTKTVIKFYRNNLSLDMFKCGNENVYTFEEEIKYNGCIVKMKIIFKTNNFAKLLHKSKSFRLKGFNENFSLFSRIDIKSFPGVIKGETKYIKYYISFGGNIKGLEKSFAINRMRENVKKQESIIRISDRYLSKSPNEIPTIVKQNVFHTYQGGRVSPK